MVSMSLTCIISVHPERSRRVFGTIYHGPEFAPIDKKPGAQKTGVSLSLCITPVLVLPPGPAAYSGSER